MADPTYPMTVGRGRQLRFADSLDGGGTDDLTTWGYQNFVPLKDSAGSEIHFIIGTGVPSADATYDKAPICSLYFDKSGGNDLSLYIKEAAGAAGWAPITTGAQA